MAIVTTVTIELDNLGAIIPEEVYVTPDTVLNFRVSGISKRGPSPFFGTILNRISFELYFENPEGLGFEPLYSRNFPNGFLPQQYPTDDILIATGTVKEKGKYKYGFRIIENGRKTYDEDPYIIVA